MTSIFVLNKVGPNIFHQYHSPGLTLVKRPRHKIIVDYKRNIEDKSISKTGKIQRCICGPAN